MLLLMNDTAKISIKDEIELEMNRRIMDLFAKGMVGKTYGFILGNMMISSDLFKRFGIVVSIQLEKEIAELRQDILHVNRLPSVVVRRIDRMEDDIRLIKTKVGMR